MEYGDCVFLFPVTRKKIKKELFRLCSFAGKENADEFPYGSRPERGQDALRVVLG